jgi:hypothetical protein
MCEPKVTRSGQRVRKIQVTLVQNQDNRVIPTKLASRQTNASKGKVVNMFTPKQKRAMLMIKLSDGKLFRMLPNG